MAERIHLQSHCFVSFFITLVHSVAGHWVWHRTGVFRTMGVIDSAGCSAVSFKKMALEWRINVTTFRCTSSEAFRVSWQRYTWSHDNIVSRTNELDRSAILRRLFWVNPILCCHPSSRSRKEVVGTIFFTVIFLFFLAYGKLLKNSTSCWDYVKTCLLTIFYSFYRIPHDLVGLAGVQHRIELFCVPTSMDWRNEVGLLSLPGHKSDYPTWTE